MNEKILIPVSIIFSGILIFFAIYLTSNKQPETIQEKQEETKVSIKKVNRETEHIEGSKDADIFLIEYSDLECIHCKNYNKNVLKKLKANFKDNKNIAYVFRHFPITNKHPSAFEEAVGLECANSLGGSENFFKMKEKIYAETASDGNFSSYRLTSIAEDLGIKKEEFEACLKKEESIAKVNNWYEEGILAGLTTTPNVFLQLPTGESYSVPADYEVISNLIDAYFNEKKY